jgi:hypothetical protein
MIKRRFMLTRFEIMNGIYLCAECHDWAESRPLDFMAWLKVKWPMVHGWVVFQRKIPSRRLPLHELKDIGHQLRLMIAKLERL